MINIYVGVMVLSALFSALSQLLLKLSTRDEHKNKIFEYLNVKVILGYGLLFSTLIMNTWAYQGVEYKLGPAINAISYVFVMIFGKMFLAERVTMKKIVGVCLIVIGICVSALF